MVYMDVKREKIACEAALEAGAVLLETRGKSIVSEEKTFLDFVSEADKAALAAAIEGHVVAYADLMGTYKRV